MAEVLFVCVHNAGRSQMAAAFFNRMAEAEGLPWRAESAGTEPGEHVHPEVAAVMAEAGIDVARAQPKVLTNEMAERARRIVTMGCAVDAGVCPAVFLKGVEDWGLPDPKDRPLAEVRAIRDDVARRVQALLGDMAG